MDRAAPRDSVSPMPGQPLLGCWRDRRLYARPPMDMGWLSLALSVSGPLIALAAAWESLRRLPLSTIERRRLWRDVVWIAVATPAAVIVTALVVTLGDLSANGDSLGPAMSVGLVSGRLLGSVSYLLRRRSLHRAHRTYTVWGGEPAAGRFIVPAVPLIAGFVLDAMVFGMLARLIILAAGGG